MDKCMEGTGMESRRCAEHGLSFLPSFWAMLFAAGAGAGGDLNLTWVLDSDSDSGSASVSGSQMGSPEMQIQE
jgi:hypothetical protein